MNKIVDWRHSIIRETPNLSKYENNGNETTNENDNNDNLINIKRILFVCFVMWNCESVLWLLIIAFYVIVFGIELFYKHVRLSILAHNSNRWFIRIISKSEPLFFFWVLILCGYGLIMCIMHYTASSSDSIISYFWWIFYMVPDFLGVKR